MAGGRVPYDMGKGTATMTKIKATETDNTFRIMQSALMLRVCPLCCATLKARIQHECRLVNGTWTPVVDPMPDGK
jgi:hypothetical protein